MSEALLELRNTLSPAHPLISQFIQGVRCDFGLDPREAYSDKELWGMLLARGFLEHFPYVVKHALHSKMCPLRGIRHSIPNRKQKTHTLL